jgi:amino acid permease
MTGSVTFREYWEETMGESGAVIVALVNTLKPALGNLAYSAILSQTLQSLFESIGWSFSRVSCLLIITVTALLPLCLLTVVKWLDRLTR